ncbi:nuclear transport factor 2 family protein [Cupriavidus pinatubonensis]|uniref:nuclear transport factor 2 family protein n=1 Tax=Cupriavidus pinatubonensis TaxID=248026 RepID=UPI001FD469D2|nr:nuclear transport factor 2 family protein [Cupriavidus pinatubonensis]
MRLGEAMFRLLDPVCDEVDWKSLGPAAIPYAGRRNTKEELLDSLPKWRKHDDMQMFEPREFIEAGDHVTALGIERFMSRPDGRLVETEWIHVFTVIDGKVVRWRGCYETAA